MATLSSVSGVSIGFEAGGSLARKFCFVEFTYEAMLSNEIKNLTADVGSQKEILFITNFSVKVFFG